MSLVKGLVARALRGELSKLDALYQRHAGEECYLFGDGVTLKWMDMHHFGDRVSILGSMMIYHKEVDALRVPYCAITEPYWFWNVFPYGGFRKLNFLRHSLHKEYRRSITEHPETTFLLNVSNYPVARFRNAVFVSRWYMPAGECNNAFRERQDSHEGTLKFQLSLAMFLGFKKAYLVGHDYTHYPPRHLHFFEKGEGLIGEHKAFVADFLDYAKQHIDLVTVTLDGGSNTIDSITYEKLTGAKPVFRENVTIVDRAKLESLAKWGGYQIF